MSLRRHAGTAAVTEAMGEHPRLLALPLDVTDETKAKTAPAAAVDRFGGIDVLLNNAGFGLLGAVAQDYEVALAAVAAVEDRTEEADDR